MERLLIVMLLLFISAGSAAARNLPPLETVPFVDVDRYLGVWYQIAFFPTRFQRADCGVIVTAEYGLDEKGRITVKNTCWGDKEMTVVNSDITGNAIPETENNNILKVRFFWWLPFRANYWIINLDEDYQYAVVSEPGRKYLWIIAREPKMERALFEELTTDLEKRGFDLSRLAITAEIN